VRTGVIRFVFRLVGFISARSPFSVLLRVSSTLLAVFHEAHQARHQLLPAADHVQSALVLMVLQHFV
jgi:hypothetical protein